MIARKHRFHGRGSLRYVYSHGRTVRSPWCALRFSANPHRQTYRAAVVVSKKNNKSAVVRNRIRRRIYEAIRLYTPETCALDMVVTVYSDRLADIPAEELQKTILVLLQDAGVGKRATSPPTHVRQDKNPAK